MKINNNSPDLNYENTSSILKFNNSSPDLNYELKSYDDSSAIFGIVIDFIENYGGIY